MFEYKVKITRVVDGDTVDADIDLGFDIIYRDRIRLMGIDTPESRTSNKQEKILGKASKEKLKELCTSNKGNIVLRTSKEGKGKFGRILGYLFTEGSNVLYNDILVTEGHARPYFGGSKDEMGEWTKEEGCSCGGKWKSKSQENRCTGEWFRWTKEGYVNFNA